MTAPDGNSNAAPPAASTTNQNSGSMKDSVQVGVVDTCIIYNGSSNAKWIARAASNNEIERARTFFVPPDNFPKAQDVLRNEKVVILAGIGCGRRYASIRLFAERGYDKVSWLDPDQPMDSVADDDLETEHGYVWNLCGSRPFSEHAFGHIRELLAATPRCGMVIILDETDHVPTAASAVLVELGAPSAIAIAENVIKRSLDAQSDAALALLSEDLAELVVPGISPEKAEYAANLALRVASGELDSVTAKREFHEGLDRELAHVMAGPWSSIEFTMMCAVALLHDEPFEEVMAAQQALDDQVRQAELPENKSFRPRRAFEKPNDRVLSTINAVTEERDNPLHPGLRMQTVRFARSGWADAVLSRIWQHYHVEHRLLLDWMCNAEMASSSFSASVRALTSLIRHVPARHRLGDLDDLVARGGIYRWRLAAVTLSRLEKMDDLRDVVHETLEQWTDGTTYRKCAVVVYQGRRFETEADDAIARLADIARDDKVSIHNVAVGTMLGLLAWSDKRDLVLRSIAGWLDDPRPRRKNDGLQRMTLDLGRYLLHLVDDPKTEQLPLDPLTVITDYPDQCRRLLRGILVDPEYGPEAMQIIARQAMKYWYFRDERKYRDGVVRLARLLELLAPEMRRLPCWRLRKKLLNLFPQFASQIPYVIRSARWAYRWQIQPPTDSEADQAEPKSGD